jgi:rsbT co-antagonist protein RsbR
MATAETNIVTEVALLRSQVATLEQLLEVHEQVTTEQNQRIEQSINLIQEQQRILHAVLNSISDAVIVADAQGQIILRNPAAHRICGREIRLGASLDHMDWPTFHQADLTTIYPVSELPLSQVLRGVVADHVELVIAHDNASHTIVSASAEPLIDEQHIQRGGVMVLQDITTRRQAEAEQSAHQQAIIEAQESTLRELSIPLIPVADDIVVMPLIGAIDSKRAQDIIRALLNGVNEQRARIIILDVTGVSIIDSQVANAIVSAAQALRLLGASVVLTGIRPEVAQTIIALGVDLSGIKTLGTLQAGIAAALRGTQSP